MLEAKDTSASALQKKRSSQKFFRRSPQRNVFQKIFQALHKILTIQNIVLFPSRGQANFRGLEASRPRPRTSKCVLEDVLEAKDVLEDSTSSIIPFFHHCLWSCRYVMFQKQYFEQTKMGGTSSR